MKDIISVKPPTILPSLGFADVTASEEVFGLTVGAEWHVPADVAQWLDQAAQQDPYALGLLWTSLACINISHFSGKTDLAIAADVGDGARLLSYQQDNARGFDVAASAVAAEMAQAEGLDEPIADDAIPQFGIFLRQTDEKSLPSNMATLPLVMCVTHGPETSSVTFHGSRAQELGHWTACFWVAVLQLARQAAQDARCPLLTLDLLPPEQRRILEDINTTDFDYRPEIGIAARFFGHAAAKPDEACIIGTDRNFSWREASEYAQRLAGWMQVNHAVQGNAVAVISDRHELCVLAFLAIILAGGTYVPISREFPQDRIDSIVREAGVDLILTVGEERENAVALETLDLRDAPLAEPVSRDPGDLAYVIYTSGSTGKPKGVCVTDTNILRLITNPNYVDWRPGDRVSFASTPAFDAATFEIWFSLLNGLSLVVVPQSVFLDPGALLDHFRDQGVTISFITTALFNNLAMRTPEVFAPLRCLLTGGDTCATELLRSVLAANRGLKIHHVYGPTENTTFSTVLPLTPPLEARASIGRPITNSTAWIVDDHMRPLPVGAEGELVVGGAGVASGYLERAELTAQKFVCCPRIPSQDETQRFYLTGDVARWTTAYTIDFLGRRDQQVKVMGYRVDLEEIRETIASQDGITHVDVMPVGQKEQGYTGINAFYCASKHVNSLELRAQIAQSLPTYMVPTQFIALDALPLTPNGKVDRKALATLKGKAEEERTGPRNATEGAILRCWQTVLQRDDIGIHQSWPSLGGNSLLLLDLAGAIFGELGVDVQLKDLVQCSTIADVSERINTMRATSDTERATAELDCDETQAQPVLPTQRQIFLNQEKDPDSCAFHVPVLLEIEGDVDATRLNRALLDTIATHAALRSSFEYAQDEIIQTFFPAEDVHFALARDNSTDVETAVRKAVSAPFDLSKPGMLRAVLFERAEPAQALLCVHHIAIDGLSLDTLLGEIAARYRGEVVPAPQAASLPAALDRTHRLLSDGGAADLDYFAQHLDGVKPLTLRLPPKQRGKKVRAGMVRKSAASTLHAAVAACARANGVTPAVVYLSVYFIQLWRCSGTDLISVGTPVAGRWHHAVAETVGMFASAVPLCQKLQPETRFKDLLQSVARELRAAQEHERVDFAQLGERLRSPAFNMLFSMQQLSKETLELGPETVGHYRSVDVPDAKYDAALRIQENDRALEFGLEYRESVLDAGEAERFLDQFHALLEASVVKDAGSLSNCIAHTITTDLRRASDTVANNNPALETGSLLAAIEQRFVTRAHKPALQDQAHVLTYATLEARSRVIANHLLQANVGQGDVAALLLPRGVDTICAMLACWRVGAAFLSLDTDWETDRIDRQLGLSGAAALILASEQEDAASYTLPKIHLDVLDPALDMALPKVSFEQDAAAYLIFTSGSTGLPKGITVSHRNLGNYASWFAEFADLQDDHASAVLTSLSYDLAYTSVWPTLLAGGCVQVLQPVNDIGTDAASALLSRFQTKAVKLTPSLLSLFTRDWQDQLPKGLELIVVGGETPRTDDLRALSEKHPHLRFVNHYGPSEATIGCIATFLSDADLDHANPPIGTAIRNMQAHVLDAHDQPLSSDIVGQLCVSGDGLSAGYFGSDDTAGDAFFDDPGLAPAKLYRTGDLAYRDSNGRLVLLGREDRQVKLRGYRVELQEVENRVNATPKVLESAAITKTNQGGDLELVIFVRTKDGDPLEEDVRTGLPKHMQPVAVHAIEVWPLTQNGKIDHAALSAEHYLRSTSDPDAPGAQENLSKTETTLAQLWRDLADEIPDPGTKFVDAGGSSLQILKLFAGLRRTFGDVVTLPELFASSIKSLAAKIDMKAAESEASAITFQANVRALSRFAQTQRIDREKLLAALVAQAVHDVADDKIETVDLHVLKPGGSCGLHLELGAYAALSELLDAIEQQWDATQPDSFAPQWAVSFAPEAKADVQDCIGEIRISEETNGLWFRTTCSKPDAVQDVANVANALQSLLKDLDAADQNTIS